MVDIMGEALANFRKIVQTLIAYCSAHRPPTEMIQFSMDRYCSQDFKTYNIFSMCQLRAEQCVIELEQFFENFTFCFMIEFRKITRTLIAYCSAHRPPTEMIQCSLERHCSQDFKTYNIFSRGQLRAEQCAIELEQFFEK